jgi:putative heme-binding domain-containing protein
MPLWATLLLFQAPVVIVPPAAEKNPFTTEADIGYGRKLFAGRCAGCHGPAGNGGKGADLAVPLLPRAADDLSLYRVIRYGIPETEMPANFMTEKEIWQISSFVRSLGQIKRESISGDPARGRSLVRGKGGCLGCHALGTEGGHIGPSLTAVGARSSAAHLRGKLLDPSAEIPEQFRLVDLVTRNGRKLSGVRLNEDTWTIQIRDFAGRLHSFEKADLSQLKVDRRTSMPSFRGKLSPKELDDVIAYLANLRGDQ